MDRERGKFLTQSGNTLRSSRWDSPSSDLIREAFLPIHSERASSIDLNCVWKTSFPRGKFYRNSTVYVTRAIDFQWSFPQRVASRIATSICKTLPSSSALISHCYGIISQTRMRKYILVAWMKLVWQQPARWRMGAASWIFDIWKLTLIGSETGIRNERIRQARPWICLTRVTRL